MTNHDYKSDLVTVIVPTHNRANLLKRSINSIIKQDYENIEIIIIQDNCNDDTNKVVKQFSDNRIKSIISNNSLGGAGARNLGIQNSNGEYIAFLDDDDEWLKNKLSMQISLLDKYDDTAIITSNFYLNDGKKISKRFTPHLIDLNDLLYLNYCGSFSFCLTKKEYLENLFIDNSLQACQDWDLWIKILDKTGLKCRSYKDEFFVNYYVDHNNRISSNPNKTYNARINFLRLHNNKMHQKQFYYNLYDLYKMKRLVFWDKQNYYSRLKQYFRALIFYHKAKYKRNIYYYLLFIIKIFNRR